MLGAGFVTRPTLDILCQSGIPVTVGKLCEAKTTLVVIHPTDAL